MINEHRPNSIVKILEIALVGKGATITKLVDKSDLTEYPEKLKLYLLSLETKILHKYMLVIGGYLDQLNVWKVPEVLDPRLRINLDGSIS